MIYLDAAATSLQKPRSVGEAVARAIRQCGSPGRGTHISAMRASEIALRCREEAAGLFHMGSPENVVFTMNATHGLNIAINSVLPAGGSVLVSGYEHNAVMRPLYARMAHIDTVRTPLFDKETMLCEFEKKILRADAVIVTSVSNVFGFILPIEEIGELCRIRGIPLIIDASQSAGSIDIDFPASGAAFCAMPGHKGLLGPQGTGLLLCRGKPQPLLFGGTGGESENHAMPLDLPDRLEAGTLNICGIAGLLEGLRFIRSAGTEKILEKEKALRSFLARRLASVPGLKVYAGHDGTQAGVLSVVPESMSCEELAELLDRAGIAVRSGLHCAPLAHATAGTIDTGTVRFSVSVFNSMTEMESTAEIVRKILKNGYKL